MRDNAVRMRALADTAHVTQKLLTSPASAALDAATSAGLSYVMALTSEQLRQFLTKGYVVLGNCFGAAAAKRYVDRAYARLGADPDNPTTWKQEKCFLNSSEGILLREFSPSAWTAVCQLVGGKERIVQESDFTFSDSFVIKFPVRAAAAAKTPKQSKRRFHWHKDGPPGRHFLDSAEMGLLLFVIWSDIPHLGGATFIACDSIASVARLLASHPEGVNKENIPRSIRCREIIELTGKVGDIILLHPFMLHSEAKNVGGPPRFFTVRILELKEPMQFNRKTADHSPVEQAILAALGKKSFSYRAKRED